MTESSAGHPCLELPAERVSLPSVAEGFEREVAVELSELVAGLSEVSSRSAADDEGSTLALLSPVEESQASLGAEGDALPSPELTEKPSLSTGVTEVSQNLPLQSVSAREETEDAAQISPDTLSENLPNTLSEASEFQPEDVINRSLIQPSVIFLTGVVSLSIVMQEPRTLFFIGLLLVLNRL